MPSPQGNADDNSSSDPAGLRAELEDARAQLEAAKVREAALQIELLHRVRNTLAVVRSIFSRTIESAETLEHVADHFRGRLDALAQYQLRTGATDGFYIEDMIRDALLAFAVTEDPRIAIEGPEVRIFGRHAEAMGLALHELATNSIKFGMLSPAHVRGTLRLHWTVLEDALSFEWLEQGISVISAAPLRRGFGRDYIERTLPRLLRTETNFEFGAGRVRCTLFIPLANHLSADAERFRTQRVVGR